MVLRALRGIRPAALRGIRPCATPPPYSCLDLAATAGHGREGGTWQLPRCTEHYPTPEEGDALIRMPLSRWLEQRVDHRCSIANPVSLRHLQPVSCPPVSPLVGRVFLFDGPVTQLDVDAIVNAANASLLGGGGVDGAIHRAAGPLLRAECARLNGCPTGQTRITKGYELAARAVLHTVGPIGEKPDLLRSCYETCIETAVEHGIRTIGFCSISTGVYGYPVEAAARVAVGTVLPAMELHRHDDTLDAVVFACFRPEERRAYRDALHMALWEDR